MQLSPHSLLLKKQQIGKLIMDDVALVLLALLFVGVILKLAAPLILAGIAVLIWIVRMMIEAKRSRDHG